MLSFFFFFLFFPPFSVCGEKSSGADRSAVCLAGRLFFFFLFSPSVFPPSGTKRSISGSMDRIADRPAHGFSFSALSFRHGVGRRCRRRLGPNTDSDQLREIALFFFFFFLLPRSNRKMLEVQASPFFSPPPPFFSPPLFVASIIGRRGEELTTRDWVAGRFFFFLPFPSFPPLPAIAEMIPAYFFSPPGP